MHVRILIAIAIFLISTMVAAEPDTKPCSDPAFRAFDFWIGEWKVKTPEGKIAGSSSIQLILDDCVIFENWTGTSGYTGKSFNAYNKHTGKWEQFWVDNRGGSLLFYGEYRDGTLYYKGESMGEDGGRILEKLTFFSIEPGHVRQLWEQSKDGGKTWITVFDGHYHRNE